MYIDKIIKKEVITLLTSVGLLLIIFIGVSFASFFSIKEGQNNVVKTGDLAISFCSDSACDTTYTNIGQVIGTTKVDGTSVPSSIYPYPNDGTYSTATPYIFKIENTGNLDAKITINLKEDTDFLPSGNYNEYTRLTSLYASHLKIAIRKRVLASGTEYQVGDANRDGIVNTNDAIYVNSFPSEPTEEDYLICDVNEDKKINASDALRIKRSVTGTYSDDKIPKTYISSFDTASDNVIYTDDTIKAGESAIYYLWLYLDETTPNQAQKTYFVGNIDVKGEYIPTDEEKSACNVTSGTGKSTGDVIKCGTEEFYVVSANENSVKALSKYNLNVGNNKLSNTYGIQNITLVGGYDNTITFAGSVAFDSNNNEYESSEIKEYVDEYRITLINKFGLSEDTITDLMTTNEMVELGCVSSVLDSSVNENTCLNSEYTWTYSTSYWLRDTPEEAEEYAFAIKNNGYFGVADAMWNYYKTLDTYFGVRPVVTISITDIEGIK